MAYSVALVTLLRTDPGYWPGVVGLVGLFSLGYALVDLRSQSWLMAGLEQARPVPDGVRVQRHAGLVQTVVVFGLGYGALLAALTLAGHIWRVGDNGGSAVAIMAAQGFVELLRAARVRRWEGRHGAVLLQTPAWRRWRRRSYLIGPAL